MRLLRLGPIAMAALMAACSDQAPNAPPDATFTIQCIRLTCTATNSSADADGAIEAYAWDFGDATGPVTTRDASHTYAAAGQFTVALTVRDDDGETSTAEHPVSVDNANLAPTASFAVACTDLTCGFTDRSLDPDGQVVSYLWDFGDNSAAATTAFALHTYATSGPHTVQLTVQDGEGASATATGQVNPNHLNVPPNVRFTYACTSLTCDFEDLSYDIDGSVTGRFWTFKDGSTSSEANPRHAFASPGVYDITLTATDDNRASRSFSALILIPFDFGAACVSTTCTFTLPPGGPWISVSWDFGDGATSSETSPTHVYEVAEPTTFTVRLLVLEELGEGVANSHKITVTP